MSPSLIDGFIADLLRKNRSERTREAYRRDISLFARWMSDEGERAIEVATPADVRAYTLYLMMERKYRVMTVRRNLCTLRALFGYLRREGIREGNPADDIDLPSPEQRKPKVLRVGEVVSILGSQRSVRDRAILELLYGSGLRRAELAGLGLDDVDLVQKIAIVTGKGNKRRMVPLTDASVDAMQAYLLVRPAAECRAFFLSNRNGALGLRQVWKIVKDAAKAGGVPRASTHAMRHSFATHFIEGGGDLSSLQRLLGHANIATTQIYIDQSIEHLRAQFAMASQRDKAGFMTR
jgi:site-specific recombinase XerD